MVQDRDNQQWIEALQVDGPQREAALAEYVAVEARNLAPLPGDVDFTVGAALVMPGLTAWQGLFEHGRLRAGQTSTQ